MTNTEWSPIPAADKLIFVLSRDVKVGRSLDGLPVVWAAGTEVAVRGSALESASSVVVAYAAGKGCHGAVLPIGVLRLF